MTTNTMDPRAAELIRELSLTPHVEGGFYRQTFRSARAVQPDDDRGERAALTTIYYLLTHGSHSRWHRVRSDEVWHFCEGSPLELFVASSDATSLERVMLGPALATDGPLYTVPAGSWQAARPIGSYALMACTVAPGFVFDDFELLAPDSESGARVLALGQDAASLS